MDDFTTTRVSGNRQAISVVIPAYNEARRLPGFLRELRAYLEQEFAGRYDIVVVDDGSDDGLARVLSAEWLECGVRHPEGTWECGIEEGAPGDPNLVLLRHEVNRGKGAALRTGVLASVGDVVLLCDADGSARIEDERRLRAAIAAGADVAVGSRYVRGVERGELRVERGEARVTRRPVRRVAGALFARVVRAMFHLGVEDTQCGFKMLRGEVARALFCSTRENGYLVDLELLLLAARRGYRVVEVPVTWREMPGSKLLVWRAAGPVAAGLWRLHRWRSATIKTPTSPPAPA